jgi:outer membrane receptor protein involved in Fe transport
MRDYMRFICITTAILVSSTWAGTAFAQVLEEVTVTAQKREETLSEVPISIIAISGDEIENRGIDSFQTLSQSMPNVFINENQIDSTISIRGVTTGNNKGFEQSVAMYFDGISYGRSQLIRTPLVDLERVEVLRGPQPTLFGKNAIAGAINVISAKPTDDFEAKISLSNEFEHDERQALAVISGPMTENLSGRLTASYREMDGWIENVQLDRNEPQREEAYVRGQLAWNNGGSLDVNFKLEHARFDTVGYAMENLNPQDGYTTVFQGPIAVDVEEDWKRASGEVSSDNTMSNAVLRADWAWGDHTLTSITGYVDYDTYEILDVDYTNLLILDDTNQQEEYRQFSQELRLTSPGGEKMDYIAGVFYQTADVDVWDNVFLGPFLGLAGPPVSLLVDSNWAREYQQSSDLWSVFAQFDFELGDRFDLTVGARYSKEDKKGSRSLKIVPGETNIAGNLPSPLPIYPNFLELLWAAVLNVGAHDISGKRSEDSFDPLVRLMFQATDSISIYGSYTEGSKAGGFDVRGNSAPGQIGIAVPGTFEFEGEEAKTYEIGAKMGWDRAQVNLSLFHTDYTDLQTNIFDGVLGFLVQNASSAEVTGIEADGRFLLTDNLQLYAAAAWNEYEYTDFPQSQCAYQEPPTTIVDGRAFCDRSGATAPYAPEFSANLGIDWAHQLTDNLDLDFNINLDHASEYFLVTNLDQNLVENGYTKLGAVIGLAGNEGKWRLSLIGDNLTDERIKVIGGTLPLARTFVQLASGGALDGVAYDAIYARPRNITLKFEYLFY